ncbi:hypothetical protein [Legionella jordanis]|uniref:Uncharacterized protein n=1 Tax=Legionella jordanis TaxID=456 RepID=A0A0W0VCB9_9GAMM|nr:hypothetical protein [Legionella jordanis]KTD17780.1 hypothetical protein Ljor_2086 [Legionella jordanis]RMX02515.1 hypothetical protein EAW55_09740 [Legionella jordanis]RMX21638.1 hypothetical protein EAS68_02455 [Legionella jordanis]VEH11284.1 Uncharacterised protein [Legionella jordanis]HAT8713749.1 hypothetical protein [Legionella jordanis]
MPKSNEMAQHANLPEENIKQEYKAVYELAEKLETIWPKPLEDFDPHWRHSPVAFHYRKKPFLSFLNQAKPNASDVEESNSLKP